MYVIPADWETCKEIFQHILFSFLFFSLISLSSLYFLFFFFLIFSATNGNKVIDFSHLLVAERSNSGEVAEERYSSVYATLCSAAPTAAAISIIMV